MARLFLIFLLVLPRVALAAGVEDSPQYRAMVEALGDMEYLPYDMCSNHCEDRARYVVLELAARGVDANFLFLTQNESAEPGSGFSYIEALPKISWTYHVAPLVRVVWEGRTYDFIVDRVLSAKPLPVAEWIAGLKVKIYKTVLTADFSFAGVFDHSAFRPHQFIDPTVNGVPTDVRDTSKQSISFHNIYGSFLSMWGDLELRYSREDLPKAKMIAAQDELARRTERLLAALQARIVEGVPDEWPKRLELLVLERHLKIKQLEFVQYLKRCAGA